MELTERLNQLDKEICAAERLLYLAVTLPTYLDYRYEIRRVENKKDERLLLTRYLKEIWRSQVAKERLCGEKDKEKTL